MPSKYIPHNPEKKLNSQYKNLAFVGTLLLYYIDNVRKMRIEAKKRQTTSIK